jgi:hypothetical protein
MCYRRLKEKAFDNFGEAGSHPFSIKFAMFDALMHAAEHRRMALFRQIGIRRELADRAQRALRSV